MINHAKNELEILERSCEDADGLELQRAVTKDVLELLETFSKQGHSGFSAQYILNVFSTLVNYKPLSPLTGDHDEWSDECDGVQQNLRCPSLFRTNRDNATAYFVDDVVFSDNGGVTWFTSNHKAKKYREPVVFPCMPPETKRVYIKYKDGAEDSDDFIDISDDAKEQDRLREQYMESIG